MKRFLILLMAGWLLPSASSRGGETAHARIYCMSLRFQQGTTYGGTLNLSSTGGSPYNGELLPYSISGREWASYFFLNYGGYGTIPGTIYVYLPPLADVNGNGFDDFFEVSQGSAPRALPVLNIPASVPAPSRRPGAGPPAPQTAHANSTLLMILTGIWALTIVRSL
jgi:hypothetical protein